MKGRDVAAIVIILIAILVNILTPIYNRVMPKLSGLTFFYWSQTLVLFLVTFLYLGFSYLVRERDENTQVDSKKGGEQK